MQALVEKFCGDCGAGNSQCLVHDTNTLALHACKPFANVIKKLDTVMAYVKASPLRITALRKLRRRTRICRRCSRRGGT